MKNSQIISIAVPPLPTFIEGNLTKYDKGALHPKRKDLKYFDIIIVKKGTLYLSEEDIDYIVKKDEMLVLLPMKHHYPTKPIDEETEFYWFHFYTDGQFLQSYEMKQLESDIPIPSLHFYNHSYTIHLQKKCKLVDPKEIHEKIYQLLLGTTNKSIDLSFWDTQQRFFSLLSLLESQGQAKDNGVILVEKVAHFIRENYNKNITNEILAEKFNTHENTIAKYMKKYYRYTPIEYLIHYRLERARELLLKSDHSIQYIAELCGFSWGPYFSSSFKKEFGLSPLQYRKKHMSSYHI